MTLKDMADEYLVNIKRMEKRLCEYNLQVFNEKGLEKSRKLRFKIVQLENIIFDNYKDYYQMLNYYKVEDSINEFKRKCS